MSRFRRRIMMAQRSGALPYDAEVEYLESTGTQFIDTGIIPQIGLESEIDFAFTALTNDQSPFGYWLYNKIIYQVALYQSRWYWGSMTSTQYNVAWLDGSPNTNRHTIKLDGNGGIWQDGTLLQTGATSSNTPTGSIYIFRRNLQGVDSPTPARIRLYSFKATLNGNTVMELIPVRVGTTGYMYDKVSGELFWNAGTGDFIIGSDILRGSSILLNGSQYIDLGYSPNPNTQIRMGIQFVENGNANIGSSNNEWLSCNNNTSGNFSSNFGGKYNQWDRLFYWFEKPYDQGGILVECPYSTDIYNPFSWFYNNNVVTFQGISTTCQTKTTTQNGTLTIGGNSLTCFNRHNLRIWSIDIYENYVLLKSFRPQRQGGIVGLYDSVNNAFVHSATGTEAEWID